MEKQMSMSSLSDELAQVRTKKKDFLVQIERIVPWVEWISIIKPFYYKGERGNKPYDLERMLCLYLLQNLYNLSNEATVFEAIDSRAFSDFYGVKSSAGWRYLEEISQYFDSQWIAGKAGYSGNGAAATKRLASKNGTIVDSTIIAAPSSTKNREKKRDPDAHQVKKGNTWHFGYKAHIGTDKDSGLVHTLEVTSAILLLLSC